MSESKKLNIERIIQADEEKKRKKADVHHEMTFRDYLELLEEDPRIAQPSPARLLEVFKNAGVEQVPDNERIFVGSKNAKRYSLLADTLFGVDRPIAEIVKYLEAGANGLSTGKQILLLVGPTASGKSTSVNLIKEALEAYENRPVFAIKGCPMHEEPLHLLPRYLREEFEDALGVKIEGDLCPVCRHMLREEFTGEGGVVRWQDVPVETFTFSVQGTRGIGSFEPSDEKSQDVTELVGRENISISTTKGHDHPLAFSLTGEIEKANRGICEGRELIKADEKLLWAFISVAEEKEVKLQGSSFPHISIDTVVIGHTNLTEFNRFSSRNENEALHDRIYVVQFPYPLRVDDEVRVYRKLIEEESSFTQLSGVHVAPGTFEVAALFAVMTRLVESDMGIDLLSKAKVYNGDKAITELQDTEKDPVDVRDLVEEGQRAQDISKREGMFGVSSRDVLAALNTQLVENTEKGCLTPLDAIRAIRDVFEHRMGYAPEELEHFAELLAVGESDTVMSEYKDFVVREVTKAFLNAYQDLAEELFDRYLKEASFYRDQSRKLVRSSEDVERDELTGRAKEPDEKFLRSVEQHVPIARSEADTFRGEILEYRAQYRAKGKEFDSNAYPPLARAVEQKLLADTKSTLTVVLDPNRPKDGEAEKRADDLMDGLHERGFCSVCAEEFVRRAAEFLTE